MPHAFLRIAAAASAVLLTTLTYPARAQVEIREGDTHCGRITRFADGILTIEVFDESAGGGWAGTITARIEDLNLDSAVVEEEANGPPFNIELHCKDDALCMKQRGHFVGLQMEGNGSPNNDGAFIDIGCSTRDECQSFLDALKASVR